MQHRGEIAERAVRQSGYSLTKLTISLEKEAEEKLPGNSAEFWKNKYLNLLEKYNALLENTSTKI